MHFIYSSASSKDDLQQGDILARSPDLMSIISEFHPYYQKSDYLAYMLLTQTCDLVQGRGELKTEYINLCAVRPLSAAVSAQIHPLQSNYILRLGNAVTEYGFSRVSQFLERLVNNNEEEYFLLHPSPEITVSEHLCAFLRLSIPIKSKHYDVCKAARMASLSPEFQAKLGWHIGKIYNRVATEDIPKEDAKRLVEKILETHVVKLEDKRVTKLKKQRDEASLLGLSEHEVRTLVRQTEIPMRKEQLIVAVLDELVDSGHIEDGDRRVVRNLLNNNPILSGIVRN